MVEMTELPESILDFIPDFPKYRTVIRRADKKAVMATKKDSLYIVAESKKRMNGTGLIVDKWETYTESPENLGYRYKLLPEDEQSLK